MPPGLLGVGHRGLIGTTDLPAYVDNDAALAGGLTAGMFYHTETGALMMVY